MDVVTWLFEVNRCYYIVICVLALSIGGCVHLRPILGTEALVVMPASATNCHISNCKGAHLHDHPFRV